MICPKCKKKLICVDTYSDLDEKDIPRTARKYKCSCGNEIYTMEQKYNIIDVLTMLAKRQHKRRK